jgi:S-DNA-T family DNA segregation ATPase FtsK/SpoIIIE
MATPATPGQPDDTGRRADVVPIDHVRAARPAPDITPDAPADTVPDAAPDTMADTSADAGPDVIEGRVVRVDQPHPAVPGDWLADLAARAADRRPVIPAWARSRAEAAATARWVGQHYAHVSAFHTARLPLYSGRLAARSPRGLARLIAGLARWTFDLEGHPVRMASVQAADPEAYLKLSRQRDARVRLRVWVAGIGTAATLAALALAAAGPGILRWSAAAALTVVLGFLGAPADRPLINRAVIPASREKLTSDVVIRALGSLGLAAVNQAIARNPRAAIDFKAPITRDGPGWRADLDLPYGVTVAEVMDRRDKLASGLRRQLGCVWPEADHAQHTGRLILWVGDQDMNAARQAPWPLLRAGAADLFRPVPVGTDQRGRPVSVTLMFTAGIIGAIPRMGKTFLLRLLALAAALDPRAELHAYDFKGTGDLSALEPVAHRYRAGDDDPDMEYAISDFRALREELRRRTKVIRGLPRDICPESKVTPELAANRTLGLHPIVIPVDECQVMFEHPKYGGEFEEICTDLVKRGPATGIVLLLATQRPDAKSLPTGISANAVLRMCLKVMGQVENDMVLGTSSYKNGVRATMFAFGDKGIFYLAGEGAAPRITRGYFLDAIASERVIARARAARQAAGRLTGHALGQEPESTGPAFDLLADLAAVITEPKLWSEVAVLRLAALRPEAYGVWADLEPDARAAQLTAALKPHGVRTGQVWGTTDDGRGANRRGITRDDITTAITHRDNKKGPGGAA